MHELREQQKNRELKFLLHTKLPSRKVCLPFSSLPLSFALPSGDNCHQSHRLPPFHPSLLSPPSSAVIIFHHFPHFLLPPFTFLLFSFSLQCNTPFLSFLFLLPREPRRTQCSLFSNPPYTFFFPFSPALLFPAACKTFSPPSFSPLFYCFDKVSFRSLLFLRHCIVFIMLNRK